MSKKVILVDSNISKAQILCSHATGEPMQCPMAPIPLVDATLQKVNQWNCNTSCAWFDIGESNIGSVREQLEGTDKWGRMAMCHSVILGELVQEESDNVEVAEQTS